jgi:hypothetical protein
LEAGDHEAMLQLLQAFFKHQPPVFDTHYILRYLSATVCSRKESTILNRIISFSKDNNMQHVMFADSDTPPSIMASKRGNLNAVIALQDDGSFHSAVRDLETGLNAAQFAMINGHDHIVQHIMCDLRFFQEFFVESQYLTVDRGLPDISDIVANTSSFGDTSLHILVILH